MMDETHEIFIEKKCMHAIIFIVGVLRGNTIVEIVAKAF